jgi:hypothetical protein
LGAGGFALYDAVTGGGLAVQLGVAGGPGSVAVIGSGAALTGALGPDGSKLMDVAQDLYPWNVNKAILLNVMGWGKPIRDVSIDAAGNLLDIGNQFLTLERQTLQEAGWQLQQGGGRILAVGEAVGLG